MERGKVLESYTAAGRKINGERLAVTHHHAVAFNLKFRVQSRIKICGIPLLGETFVVNSEPHTGARPSVRFVCGANNRSPMVEPATTTSNIKSSTKRGSLFRLGRFLRVFEGLLPTS
jgi:hypothetical protein